MAISPRTARGTLQIIPWFASVPFLVAAASPAGAWNFTNVTNQAQLDYGHGYLEGMTSEPRMIAGGVAAGDYDNDGFVDLYTVRGNVGPNLLFRNLGNGFFDEVGAAAGVALAGTRGSGPVFADYDGDGWLDLFVGGIAGTAPTLFRNLGNGTFQNVTAASGISVQKDTFSACFGDYDRDGDLDLVLSHWGNAQGPGHFWRNNGDGTFTESNLAVGFVNYGAPDNLLDYTFTPNLSDINNDGWPDLVMAADFRSSNIFLNDGDGTFTKTTNAVITDENGMGSALGDYDHDGDLDWFVSSIWEPGSLLWGITGNRLYRNLGDGSFEDVTSASGVRVGHWGWGSSFADLNNDMHLDIAHVNGWYHPTFSADPALVYLSNGDGTFTEQAGALSFGYLGQGRGIVCFDFDRDGDLDVFVSSNGEKHALYRNDGANASNYVGVDLLGESPNTEGVGSRVYVTAGGITQMREIRAGSNFESQDPTEAHFGMASVTTASELRVVWPSGATTVLHDVPVNQRLSIAEPAVTAAPLAAVLGGGVRTSPNPFRDVARFELSLPAAGDVRLTIYDVAGRVVRSSTTHAAVHGPYATEWTGRTDAGVPVPHGVYLYEFVTPADRHTGKVTRLR